MPPNIFRGEFTDSVSWVKDKPEKIFDQPKYFYTGQGSAFQLPVPLSDDEEWGVKHKEDKTKYPGMVSGKRSPSPENIDKPTVVNFPGWQRACPAMGTFDLDFHLGKAKSEDAHPENQ